MGLNDGFTTSADVIKISLHRPNKILNQEKIPATMRSEIVANVYCNTVYISGLGSDIDEIWKYNMASGWIKCASFVQGRRRHSAAFINDVLYICGGNAYSNGSVLDSVEAFNLTQSPLNAREWESLFTVCRIQAISLVFHLGVHFMFLVEKTNTKNTEIMFKCTT